MHINSGIPNHAFYLAATALGGHAWERAGQVWYDALTGGGSAPTPTSRTSPPPRSTRRGGYGATATEKDAVRNAWTGVGVVL